MHNRLMKELKNIEYVKRISQNTYISNDNSITFITNEYKVVSILFSKLNKTIDYQDSYAKYTDEHGIFTETRSYNYIDLFNYATDHIFNWYNDIRIKELETC